MTFWILDALADEDTSEHNRINEVSKAANMPVVGIVAEPDGGVIGYVHPDYAERLLSAAGTA